MEKSNKMDFNRAYASLQKLVNQIEQEDISLDQLTEKIKEARSFIEFCTSNLRQIENDVKNAAGDHWPED